MKRSLFVFLSLLFVVLFAFPQGVSIVSPKDGETVHSEVPIKIEAERGYARIMIDGEFLAAVNLPATFIWDTNAPYGFGGSKVKDGEHTISVVVYDGQEIIGQAQVKVIVKNKIEFPLGEGVKLYYRYKEGEEHIWKTNASREGIDLELQWKEICNEILKPKGSPPIILLTDRVESGKLVYQRGMTSNYQGVGNYFFLNIYQNGDKADILSALRGVRGLPQEASTSNLFGWGQLRISFPDTEVKIGEPWQASIVFVADIESGEPRIALATHKIEDVVWMRGYKCFKIKSTYEWRGEISVGTQAGGMTPGMMGPGAMPGMMGPGMMGPGGMVGMMGEGGSQQGSTAGNVVTPTPTITRTANLIPVIVQGERTTYFAFEEGKQVKIEEEVRVTPRFGRREGQPSGMMPGMIGPGGMPPGEMPGMMGPGMMGPG
ncbi:MAG: hypothetical protein ACP5KZ_01970, partial [bacterium]